MARRLLFVDDEATLLRSMDRAFGLDYDVTAAESGPEAIDRISHEAPYQVVVTDMRMPVMNGIEFIQSARKVSPDSVYIMLTGNQDFTTATSAVNDGEVFRFLNKPCDVEELRGAIESGVRLYDLESGKKELLHKTFVGAVSCVTGVLERAYPDLAGAGSTVGRVIGRLCEAVGVDDRWEFKLAGRLSLIGFALLDDDREKMHEGVDPIGREDGVYRRAAQEASALIDKIPRLETVAKIIEQFPDSDGSICSLHPKSDGAIRQVGASLLRIALQARHAFHQGLEPKRMAEEVRASLPNLLDSVYEALSELEPVEEETRASLPVRLKMLKPGMVLSKDLESPTGGVILRKGRRLDPAIIEKIHEAYRLDNSYAASVTVASYESL